jgi:hypothetical protein
MSMAGAASLLGGGAYLGGAFEAGEYYPMAPSAVETRLAGLNFGPELGGGGADGIGLALRSRGPKLMRWDLMMGGRKTGEVRAVMSPDDAGTRVSVDFQFTDSDATMGLENDPFLNDVARIAMEEKVDSVLDGRAFNTEMVHAKMAAMIASNPQAVSNMQKSLQQNVERDLAQVEREMEQYAPVDSPFGTGHGSDMGPNSVSETHADGGWGNK